METSAEFRQHYTYIISYLSTYFEICSTYVPTWSECLLKGTISRNNFNANVVVHKLERFFKKKKIFLFFKMR
jgi:hypothetical protein